MKRGGLRVVYVYVEEEAVILLLGLYGKGEATDLTYDQKQVVSELAEKFRQEVRNRRESR